MRHAHTQLVLVCDRRDLVMSKKTRASPIHVELDVALGTERRVRGDYNLVVLRKGDKALLSQVWVQLDLENGGFDARIPKQVDQKSALEVTVQERQHVFEIGCS